MSHQYTKPLETVERACTKCHTLTLIKRFPDNTWCSACKNADTRARKLRDGEAYRLKLLQSSRKRRALGKTREADRRNAAIAFQRRPLQARARALLKNARLRGEITKPGHCSGCESTGRIEGHHHDYNKPLEVVWLCVSCHRALHRRMKEEG